MARTGRWRTGLESRERILAAARSHLMRGYDEATVRGIAAEAGVDVAMVYYFFGSKQGLFAAVIADTGHPLRDLQVLVDEGADDLGPRLVRGFLERWDAGNDYEPCVALWQSAAACPRAKEILLETVHGPIAERLSKDYGITDAALRVELAISHLMGVAVARYRLGIEPLASIPRERVVALVGPTIQRYLTEKSAPPSRA
jgi:AcrR family transcriptional regulator